MKSELFRFFANRRKHHPVHPRPSPSEPVNLFFDALESKRDAVGIGREFLLPSRTEGFGSEAMGVGLSRAE
eukprot:scaffold682_cov363-Pavlova_lutheri.AAC.35